MSWLKQISDRRAGISPEQQADAAKKKSAEATAKKEAPAFDTSVFEGVLSSEKVINEHGAVLKNTLPEMQALSQRAETLPAWRAVAFNHATERFYGVLHRQLSALPAKDRVEAAKISIEAMTDLVRWTGRPDILSPSMNAYSDLTAWASRPIPGKAPLTLEELTQISDLASRTVRSVAPAIEGRSGLASGFNVLPALIAQIEKGAGEANIKDRLAVWEKVVSYIGTASPREALDQVIVAQLSRFLADGLKQHPKNIDLALAAATKAAHAEHQDFAKVSREHAQLVREPIRSALVEMIDQNPAGPPALFAAIDGFAQSVHASGAADPAVLENVAKLLRLIGGTPVARRILEHLSPSFANLANTPGGQAGLAVAANAASLDEVPAAIVSMRLSMLGRKDDFEVSKILEQNEGADAVRLSLAALPYLENAQLARPILRALAAYGDRGDPEAYAKVAARFAVAYPALANAVGAEMVEAAALNVSSVFLGETLLAKQAQDLATIARSAAGMGVNMPVASILMPDLDKRPGLFTLLDKAAFRYDPVPYLWPLLRSINEAQLEDPAHRLELSKLAIRLASEIGKLDRDPAKLVAQVQADFKAALLQGENLHFAIKGGSSVNVRAGGARPQKVFADQPAALRFAREHPSLPPELLFTAGIHLSNEQVTWMTDQLNNSRSRANNRVLRDAVFGAITAQRTDFVEALRTSRSPSSAIAAALVLAANETRAGQAVPFDRLIEGLNAGRDPASEIDAERSKAALDAIGLNAADGIEVDPQGLEILKKHQPAIQALFAFMPDGQVKWQPAQNTVLKEKIAGVLSSIIKGEWPDPKYNDALADAHLEGLSDRAKALWASEGVTGAAAKPIEATPEIIEASFLLRGLRDGLVKEVTLAGVPGMKLEWNEATRDALRAAVEIHRTALYEVKKGSPDHRSHSGALKPIRDCLSVLELKLHLDKMLEGGAADPVQMLLDAKPLVSSARSAAKRLGGKSCATALARVQLATPEVIKSTRQGVFAADEDRLEAYFTSFGGSCLNPENGSNRGGLAELMASAQYKMGRIMDGEKCEGRAILRLLKVEAGNGYNGHALYSDMPVLPTAWGTAAAKDKKELYYRHLIHKAWSMGIPFFTKDPVAKEVAKTLGVEPVDTNIKVTIAAGHTGLHHNQGIGDYWAPPGANGVHVANYNYSMIMPPA